MSDTILIPRDEHEKQREAARRLIRAARAGSRASDTILLVLAAGLDDAMGLGEDPIDLVRQDADRLTDSRS